MRTAGRSLWAGCFRSCGPFFFSLLAFSFSRYGHFSSGTDDFVSLPFGYLPFATSIGHSYNLAISILPFQIPNLDNYYITTNETKSLSFVLLTILFPFSFRFATLQHGALGISRARSFGRGYISLVLLSVVFFFNLASGFSFGAGRPVYQMDGGNNSLGIWLGLCEEEKEEMGWYSRWRWRDSW